MSYQDEIIKKAELRKQAQTGQSLGQGVGQAAGGQVQRPFPDVPANGVMPPPPLASPPSFDWAKKYGFDPNAKFVPSPPPTEEEKAKWQAQRGAELDAWEAADKKKGIIWPGAAAPASPTATTK